MIEKTELETEKSETAGTVQHSSEKAKRHTLPEELLEAPLIHGGLWKAIWLMSWPLLIQTVAMSVVGAVDVQMSGYLGSNSQAAVGLSEHVIFMFMVIFFSISVGTTAIVSREFGEGNAEGTIRSTTQSLVVSVTFGFVMAIAALSFARLLLPLFSKSPAVIEQGTLYLSIFGLYMIPFSLICITGAAFRAIGDSKTPLWVILVQVSICIIGDYLTVVKGWPVPGLGLRGIAISAVLGAFTAAALSIFMVYRSPLKECLTFKRLSVFDWELQKRILKIGIPTAVQRLGWNASVFAVFFILSQVKEQTAALAAWTIGMRIEALLFMPLMAFSTAVSSIVGQNLGAGKPERATKAGWNVTVIGVIMMIVLAAGMFFGSETIARFMSQDPKAIEFTSNYLKINALSEPFLAVAMVLMGAMQGAGDTKVNMWISLFCNWIVRLPVAWYLALNLNLGTNGVWIAMATSVTVCAFLCAARYRSGKWLKVKV